MNINNPFVHYDDYYKFNAETEEELAKLVSNGGKHQHQKARQKGFITFFVRAFFICMRGRTQFAPTGKRK